MGFKGRLKTVVKSQFNHWVTLSEDPEKIINQAVEEIDEALLKVRGKAVALGSRVEGRKKLIESVDEQIEEALRSAQEFVRDEMEENAREAIRRKRFLEEQRRNLTLLQKDDCEALGEMSAKLKELEARVRTARSKREMLLKTIRLNRGVMPEGVGAPQRGDTVSSDDPFGILGRMEERVERERALSAALCIDEAAIKKEDKLIEEELQRIKKNIKKGGHA